MLTRMTVLALTWAVLGTSPAWADYTLQRQLALAPGGTFVLDADVGSVTVTGDSASGALVALTAADDDFERTFDVQIEERAGVASVRVKRRLSWTSELFGGGWFRGRDVRLTIRVPRSTTVSMRTSGGALHVERLDGPVNLKTSGGSIDVRGIRGNVDADTSGGGITVADVRGAVRADTSGGPIEIDAVTGAIDARTSGGGVRIRGAGGRVDARTSGGGVTVGFAPGNSQGGNLSSSGGAVRAEIDPAVSLSVEASSSGGGVQSDVPVTVRGRISRNSLSGDLNGGGSLLRLRSSGGGVRVAASSTARP